MDWFTELYRKHHSGSDPTWGGRQHGQLKQLLKKHEASELRARGERMASTWRGGWDLGTLVQHWDKFAPNGAGSKTGHYKHTGDEAYAGGAVDL